MINFLWLIIVGKTGFEPATPWSQTRCATGLRYFPDSLRFMRMGCKCKGIIYNNQRDR